MNNDTKLEIVRQTQEAVEQMRIDDLEEQPEEALLEFTCDCCGEIKQRAGCMIYGNFTFCNTCVLYTETSMALEKISDPLDMMDIMKDKRFDNLYHTMFNPQENINN